MNHFSTLLFCSALMIVQEFEPRDKYHIITSCLSDSRVLPHVEMNYLDDSGKGYILLEKTDFVTKDLKELLTQQNIKIIDPQSTMYQTQNMLRVQLVEDSQKCCMMEISRPSTSFNVVLELKKRSQNWYVSN